MRTRILACLLLTAACTQEPSQVEMKGQGTYAQRGAAAASRKDGTYHTGDSVAPEASSPSRPSHPVSQTTESNAAVQSIGVSDLAPPSKQAPAKQAAASAPAPAQGVNPWTNKPRFSETGGDSAPGVDASKEKTTAQLDSVIGNDGDKAAPVAAAASVQKVAKAETPGFAWPVASHKIISAFGPKGGGKSNDGINIASAEGEPVWAAAGGEVVYAGNELAGYGNMVLIKHAGGKTTSYAHLSRATVDKYDRVKQGDIIGYVGSTGDVKSPQLHFAVRNGKEPVDPQTLLK